MLVPVGIQWRTVVRPVQLGVVLQDVHHDLSHSLDLSICTWRCTRTTVGGVHLWNYV